MIIKEINEQSKTLTEKEIEKIFDSQVAQVKAVRPEIGISPPQRRVMLDTLFQMQQ